MNPRILITVCVAYSARLVANTLPLFVVCSLAPFSIAQAIDEGGAKGSLTVNGETVILTHAYAQLRDAAEGVGSPKELRILLTDREVRQQSLNGLEFLPVEAMAKAGQVRGLLIRQRSDNAETRSLHILMPPNTAGQMMMTMTLSGENYKDFKFGSNRVSGMIETAPEEGSLGAIAYRVTFSAPVFNEPAVTE